MATNVLVIDDSVEIQMLLKLLLESKGFHVECSSNGEEALHLLSLREVLPDLIFLDLQMPVMNGLSFLNIRKTISRLENIPIVLMSGEEDVFRTGEITRVDQVLKKPLNMVSVVRAAERNSKLH